MFCHLFALEPVLISSFDPRAVVPGVLFPADFLTKYFLYFSYLPRMLHVPPIFMQPLRWHLQPDMQIYFRVLQGQFPICYPKI